MFEKSDRIVEDRSDTDGDKGFYGTTRCRPPGLEWFADCYEAFECYDELKKIKNALYKIYYESLYNNK